MVATVAILTAEGAKQKHGQHYPLKQTAPLGAVDFEAIAVGTAAN